MPRATTSSSTSISRKTRSRQPTRLRIGSALLEVTPTAHTGCKKFSERFGLDALKWVNDHRDRRLRGMNCRVLEAGLVSVGDPVEVA